jgi:hypothetical protein
MSFWVDCDSSENQQPIRKDANFIDENYFVKIEASARRKSHFAWQPRVGGDAMQVIVIICG